jgi:hypothetical protein
MAMSEHPITSVDHAAQSIVALINSNPRSPTIDELAAVLAPYIKGTQQLAPDAIDGQLNDWVRVVDEYLDKTGHGARRGLTDEEHDKIDERFCAVTKAFLARPCRTWNDVVLRAAIAAHWNSPYPDEVIAENPDKHFDKQSLAYLVRGILDIAGLAFDNEGRLLSGQGMWMQKPAIALVSNFFYGHSTHRAEWDALVREEDEAQALASRIEEQGGSNEAITAADEFAYAVSTRLEECAKRIFRTPAQNLADILLLTEACFRTLWVGTNLFGPDADARMARGPDFEIGDIDDPCGEALVALLKGIRDLLMAPPRKQIVGVADEDFDGEPVAWSAIDAPFDAQKFVTTDLTLVQLAFQFLGKDHLGAREDIRRMLADEDRAFDRPGGEVIKALLDDWEEIAHKLVAMAQSLRAAHRRAVISFSVVAPDHPAELHFVSLNDAAYLGKGETKR